MLYVTLLFILGLILICLAGDKLVDAAVSISSIIGIPQIVVGATIVSFCTTMPEMLVSTTAILDGSAAISVGNAFGSIICNTGLIAGISLTISPSGQSAIKAILWRCVFFFTVAVCLFACGITFGSVSTPFGIALLILFGIYAWMSIRLSKYEDDEDDDDSDNDESSSMTRNLITLVICAILLFVGANLLVNNGTILATYLGIPERAIAVTAIALGTSLPELVTTIMSLIKKHANIGIGNVIGANLLNILLVIGIPATFSVIPLSTDTLYTDIPLAIGVMLLLALPIMIRKKSSRIQGILLLAIYFIYCFAAL